MTHPVWCPIARQEGIYDLRYGCELSELALVDRKQQWSSPRLIPDQFLVCDWVSIRDVVWHYKCSDVDLHWCPLECTHDSVVHALPNVITNPPPHGSEFGFGLICPSVQ